MWKSVRSTNLLFNKDTGVETLSYVSPILHREVQVDVFLPPRYLMGAGRYPVLYLNDGQDMEGIHLRAILDRMYGGRNLQRMIVVAIHAGERIQEYGTAGAPDYKERGSKSAQYQQFILTELMPFINGHYHTRTGVQYTAFAGFSLGGLAAFDMVWTHPQVFGAAGAFSGSFWWRSKAYEDGYDDYNDRIMQRRVRETEGGRDFRCWLQTGTDDETDDRNGNGVIDSIDDTLDLIAELEQKGYQRNRDIRYVEVQGGRHDLPTWAGIMPDFLEWLYPA
ncbi:MAG: esterase family protein [Bacteroidetes bacterium]|nr:MAG: esterase family protein [Bacteroidota bacterium]